MPPHSQNRPAELIARFIDAKLRSGNKGTSEEEMEAILDKVVMLFRYLQEKDLFEKYYKYVPRMLIDEESGIPEFAMHHAQSYGYHPYNLPCNINTMFT